MMTIATHSKANFSIIIKSYPLHIGFKPAYTPNIQKSVDSSIFFLVLSEMVGFTKVI